MTKTGVGEHLVIFKLGALGDAAMLVPSVVALKRQTPELKITWICGQSIEGLLKSCSWIDELIVVDDKKIFGKGYKRIQEGLNLRRKISHLSPSHVFFGNPDWRYRALLFGFAPRAKRGVFLPIQRKSHFEQYANALSDLMGQPISLEYNKFNNNLVSSALPEALQKTKCIVLAPGGARNALADDAERRAPVEVFSELATQLKALGHQIVLIGGATDEPLSEKFNLSICKNLINKTTLSELVAVIKSAELVISNDSGPLYLALSSGVKAIGLYGPTEPRERIPANLKSVVGMQSLATPACRPCYNGKAYGQCANPICVQTFSVKDILASVEELFSIQSADGSVGGP